MCASSPLARRRKPILRAEEGIIRYLAKWEVALSLLFLSNFWWVFYEREREREGSN